MMGDRKDAAATYLTMLVLLSPTRPIHGLIREVTLLGGKVLFQLKYVTCFPGPGAALPLPILSERVTSASSVPYL